MSSGVSAERAGPLRVLVRRLNGARLGEVLGGASQGTARRGSAVTRATSVTPSLGLHAPEVAPPRVVEVPNQDAARARPLR